MLLIQPPGICSGIFILIPGQPSATVEDSFAAETGINYTIKIIQKMLLKTITAEVFVQ